MEAPKNTGAARFSADIEKFKAEVAKNVQNLGKDKELHDLGLDFLIKTRKYNYTYNFSWMGLPIIQFPQDIIAMQEVIWQVQPNTIVEAGIARGGSLVFYASMLEMMGLKGGKVIGIDIDIRAHNRRAIESHPMGGRITLIEGSSIDPDTVAKVKANLVPNGKTIVCLDSMHTHDHVLAELRAYSPLVTAGSYLVVFDTSIEYEPENSYPDRPWDRGNNPYTAVSEFLEGTRDFMPDDSIPDKLLITEAPRGYLRRTDQR